MAPDADKYRQRSETFASVERIGEEVSAVLGSNSNSDNNQALSNDSLECVYRRVLTDFSYIEQPVRCFLKFQQGEGNKNKALASNGKSGLFMSNHTSSIDHGNHIPMDEFSLLPESDGSSVAIQITKTGRFLCSSVTGSVYASETRHEEFGRWTVTESEPGAFCITSVLSDRQLNCIGNVVQTTPRPRNNGGNNTSTAAGACWSVDVSSGELCFLSCPTMDRRIRCDLTGNMSMSKNFQGWEAWRFSKVVGHPGGGVRISPWAHSQKFLSSNDQGRAYTIEDRDRADTWTVERAPLDEDGLFLVGGVILKSTNTGRVLRYDTVTNTFCTVATGTPLPLDEFCVWELESLHRQTYYLLTNDATNRRLEAPSVAASGAKSIGTRRFPGRLLSEEWKVQETNEQGVVTILSRARRSYLVSNASGDVSLVSNTDEDILSGGYLDRQWIIEEQEQGFVLRSKSTQRVLVCPNDGPICTVPSGTQVLGCTRWKLEPKICRQINKEKMQAVGAALAIGVATTVATPFVIGSAIGIIGISQIGVAGQVAIGSIRAAEALSSISRVTVTSSQLVMATTSSRSGQSSILSAATTKTHHHHGKKRIGNIPL